MQYFQHVFYTLLSQQKHPLACGRALKQSPDPKSSTAPFGSEMPGSAKKCIISISVSVFYMFVQYINIEKDPAREYVFELQGGYLIINPTK